MREDLDQPRFFFSTCQVGAEEALKFELQQLDPSLKLAYSRPGFLTLKGTEPQKYPVDYRPTSIFARSWSQSCGGVRGESPREIARQCAEKLAVLSPACLHVWTRDKYTPGHRGYEAGLTPDAREGAELLLTAWPHGEAPALRTALRGERVADCVIVQPNEWYVGYHAAHDYTTCLPGGLDEIAVEGIVSRAGIKLESVLRWSEFPLMSGQTVAELGCAPGGASQLLLARGLKVIGVDPAEVAPEVLNQRGFTHIRKRAHEVRRREFSDVTWLTCDINAAPAYTLDAVGAIVCHEEVKIQGLLLTMKLLEWSLARQSAEHMERVRSWGFTNIRAAQLQYHRQEYVIAARR